MRIAGLLVIVGCGASSPPATPTLRAHPCESAHWSELAQSRLRVWPAQANAPAHVVEVAGALVEVASVTSSVIVTRWVRYASLAPIAMSATSVSPTRGAAPDPTSRILVGHRLDPPSYGWSAVHAPDGYVPASFAGTMWTDPEPVDESDRDRRYLRSVTGEIRAAADDAAPIRWTMTTPTIVHLRAGAPKSYVAVTVQLPYAELDGFWKPPPQRPRTPEEEAMGEIEISEEVPPIHSPIASGTCLYDAPRGRSIGMILGEDAFATPVPAKVAGWYAATIPTIWGPSTYYIDTPPIAPPPPPSPEPPPDTWRWGNEW